MELRADLSNVFDGDEDMFVLLDLVDDSFDPRDSRLVFFLHEPAKRRLRDRTRALTSKQL